MTKILKKINPVLFILSLVYLFFIYLYSGFVPLWDSYEYVDIWLFRAVTSPFNLFNFNLTGHPSMVYVFLTSLGQYIDFGNMPLLNFNIAVFSVMAILAFYGLLRNIFYKTGSTGELYLLTFIFVFYPPFIANALQYSPDYGQFVFFVIFLYLLLTDRFLLTVIAGSVLVFTKEPAIILYTISVFFYLLYRLIKSGLTRKNIILSIKKFLILGLPILIFLIQFIAVKTVFLKESVFRWYTQALEANTNVTVTEQVIADRIPFSYFLAIFVVNFNWILSIFFFISFVYFIIHLREILSKRNYEIVFPEKIIFIFVLFIFLLPLLTSYQTFTNTRYFLPLYILLIILFFAGLRIVVRSSRIRKLILSILLLLFFAACFRTIDPVSKKIYGTFKFGSHDMLKMTSITGECCGYGRDQLVYNLEYTKIHFLINDILVDIKPDVKTVFTFDPMQGPYVLVRMDKDRYQRTVKRNNTLLLEYLAAPATWKFNLLPEKPRMMYFIEYPNVENISVLNALKQYYSIKGTKQYERDGYVMKVYTMEYKAEIL